MTNILCVKLATPQKRTTALSMQWQTENDMTPHFHWCYCPDTNEFQGQFLGEDDFLYVIENTHIIDMLEIVKVYDQCLINYKERHKL